jgi:hypothetical protein
MCKESNCGCCQGPIGPQGLQGIQGIAGQTGSQGIQGLQGPAGKDGEGKCTCVGSYANVYSSMIQTVEPYLGVNDSVRFEKQNAVKAADFDLSNVASTGEIVFLKKAVYLLSWTIQGRVTPPVPSPVPSFSFGFWINGVLAQGSVYSQYTQSPNDDAAHLTGEIIVEMSVGDRLKLRNTSVVGVSLNPNINGSVFPITVAGLCIESIE